MRLRSVLIILSIVAVSVTIALIIHEAYKPQYKDNTKKQGHETYIYPNGDKYVGEWKDGKRHGYGTVTYVDGEKFEGEWKDGIANGQGIYTFTNGEKFEGELIHKESK